MREPPVLTHYDISVRTIFTLYKLFKLSCINQEQEIILFIHSFIHSIGCMDLETQSDDDTYLWKFVQGSPRTANDLGCKLCSNTVYKEI